MTFVPQELSELFEIQKPKPLLKTKSGREYCQYCRQILKNKVCKDNCKKIMIQEMRKQYSEKIQKEPIFYDGKIEFLNFHTGLQSI